MEITIKKTDGSDAGRTVELSDTIFGIEPNNNVMYEDIRRIQAHARQGNAHTKERGQVRGGGRKAYRQKGTGMARRGSIRSPLLKGGGTVFGPQKREYRHGLSKKMRRLARKSALSFKAADSAVHVLEDFEMDAPKTRQFIDILTALELNGKKVLFLTDGDKNIYLSGRNVPTAEVIEASNPNTFQILNADAIVVMEGAVAMLEQSVEPKNEEAAA